MKAAPDCYQCLRKSIYQAAELATGDKQTRAKAIREGLKALEENFSLDKVSIIIAAEVHRVIREVTQNPDPYLRVKEKEFMVAEELYRQIDSEYGNDFRSYLKLAAKGNALDFFKPPDTVREDMKQPLDFRSSVTSVNQVLELSDHFLIPNQGVFYSVVLPESGGDTATTTTVADGIKMLSTPHQSGH